MKSSKNARMKSQFEARDLTNDSSRLDQVLNPHTRANNSQGKLAGPAQLTATDDVATIIGRG